MHVLQTAEVLHEIGDHRTPIPQQHDHWCSAQFPQEVCEPPLIVTEDLAGEIDKGGQTYVILLKPLTRSYTSVSCWSLISVASEARWIEDLLSERTQQVVVEGEHAYTCWVTAGVPRDCTLGPSLFLICINDLGAWFRSNVCLFTDDIILYSVIRTPTGSTHRTTSKHWSPGKGSSWLMSFNVEKCHQTDYDQEKEKDLHQLHTPQPNPWASRQRKVPWSRVYREE